MSKQTFLKIGLSEELRKELERMAAETGDSIAAIIRDELEFAQRERQRYDGHTLWLGGAVQDLANGVGETTGVNWYEHPAAREALAIAIQAYMAAQWPAQATKAYLYDPKTVGLMIARMLKSDREAFDREANEAMAAATSAATPADKGGSPVERRRPVPGPNVLSPERNKDKKS
jgi:hypothetical protein